MLNKPAPDRVAQTLSEAAASLVVPQAVLDRGYEILRDTFESYNVTTNEAVIRTIILINMELGSEGEGHSSSPPR